MRRERVSGVRAVPPAEREDLVRAAGATSALLAVALLVHVLWWHGPVAPIRWLVVVGAAAWALGRPTAGGRLVVLLGAGAVAALLEAPEVASHLLIPMLAGVAALAHVGARIATGRTSARAALDAGLLFARLAPFLRAAVVVLYLAAALAKLNAGYLDPATSPAPGLAARAAWPLPAVTAGDWHVMPAVWGALAVELLLPVLLLLPRTRRAGLLLGLAFHAVLGLAGTVPFTALVLALYVAFVPPSTLRPTARLRPGTPSGRRALGAVLPAVVLLLWGAGALTEAADPDATGAVIRTVLPVLAAAACGLAAALVLRGSTGPRTAEAGRPRGAFAVALVALAAWACTPYLGVRAGDAFTMYSALDTSAAGWNHLLLPGFLRLSGLSAPRTAMRATSGGPDPGRPSTSAGAGPTVRPPLRRGVRARAKPSGRSARPAPHVRAAGTGSRAGGARTGRPHDAVGPVPPADGRGALMGPGPHAPAAADLDGELGPMADRRDVRDAFVAGMRDGVLVLDADGRLVDVNPAAERHLGRTRETLLSLHLSDLHAGEDREAGWQRFVHARDGPSDEVRTTVFLHRDGARLLVEEATGRIEVDGRRLVQSTFRPVGEASTMRERLLELAYVDPVTGLGNRAALHRVLDPLVDDVGRGGPPVAILFLDLDRFKPVNDLLGHEAGDRALRLLGGRLGAVLGQTPPDEGPPPQVFRLAGDEFVAVLPATDLAGATTAAGRVALALDTPLDVDGRRVLLPASVGVAVAPDHATDARGLLAAADMAMYAAKRTPRPWVAYERSFADAERAERDLEEGLRLAIADGAVDVGFVPQVVLRTGRIDALVAVPRWPDVAGDLDHLDVLRLAERAGAARELETLVLARALGAAARWGDGPRTPRLWLPLGAAALTQADLAGRLRRALALSGVPADRLTLDLHDVTPLDARGVRDQLLELRAAGATLALSDRRTSFRTLATAIDVGLDRAVTDVALARQGGPDGGWARVLSAATAASTVAGIHIVGAGVGDLDDLRTAIDLGCTSARGDWFGPALHPAAAHELVRGLRHG